MGDLQPWHVIVLVVVLFVLFGAKRMPDMARSVGQSLRIFKSEMRQGAKETEEMNAHVKDSVRVDQQAVTQSAPVADAAQAKDADKTHQG